MVSSQKRRATVLLRTTADKHVVSRGFCSSVGLHKIFVLPSTMPWRFWGAIGSVLPFADRPVGVPPCPATLCPAALPCAAPPRPARGMPGFWIRPVPGYALHEKRFTKIKWRRFNDQQPGTKSGRRPADRWSNTFVVPPSVYIGFRWLVLLKRRSEHSYDALAGARDGCLLGEPIRRCAAPT